MNPCLENIILFTEFATKYEANMTGLSVYALLYLDQLTYHETFKFNHEELKTD